MDTQSRTREAAIPMIPTSLPTVISVIPGLLKDNAKTSGKFVHTIMVVTPPIKPIFNTDLISSTMALTENIFLIP